MPRAGLTPDRVVVEAEQLVDEVGMQQLTLAAVAARFGVRQPSLYKHVESLGALEHRIAIRAKVELGDVLGRAAIGRSQGDAITAMARAYRDWALQHPGRYEAAQRAPIPGDAEDEAASDRVVNVVATVIERYQLRDDDAIDAIRAYRSAVHGFVSLEAGGGFGLPVSVNQSFERLICSLTEVLSNWNTATKCVPRAPAP